MLARHGLRNPRVFGSVARGTDRDDSDIDLLVRTAPNTSLFDLARAEYELTALLGVPVDMVPDSQLRKNVAMSADRDTVPL